MNTTFVIREVAQDDYAGWRVLWDGYNAFYGREGDTALDEAITLQTWQRFFDAASTFRAFVAIDGSDTVIGIVHLVLHPSTSRMNDVCYLQDLFTAESSRGRGVGRALIDAAGDFAKSEGCSRLYWHTYDTNTTARRLYDSVTPYKGAIVYSQDLA